jgi:hypothetical protein
MPLRLDGFFGMSGLPLCQEWQGLVDWPLDGEWKLSAKRHFFEYLPKHPMLFRFLLVPFGQLFETVTHYSLTLLGQL